MSLWIDNAQLGSALLKGTVLLLATALAACLMKRVSAASQFQVCFVGLCMSLLVAVTSVVASVSELEYSLLLSQPREVAETSTVEPEYQFAVERQHRFGHGSQASLRLDELTDPTRDRQQRSTSFGTSANQSGAESKTSHAQTTHSVEVSAVANAAKVLASEPTWLQTWMPYWPYLWFMGASLVFLRLLIPYWLSAKALQRLEKAGDSGLTELNDKLARQWQLPAPGIWLCSETITPFIFGLWQPKIVLPRDASSWSEQRITFVLLHEMAHIRRRDLLTQFVAEWVIAVNWFNPVSWWLYAQMKRLRELACDDLVLLQEQQPASYAETLLDVATQYRSLAPTNGITMAGKLEIARRIECVLDSSRVRTPFGKRTISSAVGVTFILCLTLGMVQLRSRATEPMVQTGTQVDGQKASEPNQSAETKTAESRADSKPKDEVNEAARSMLIRVLDEQSKPLEGVDVFVTGVDFEPLGNLPRIHYFTDAEGTTSIKFRDGKLNLQLWPRLKGYVPQYVALDERKFALPSEYTFHFEKGERLAGKILDDSGRPIANASVQVKTNGIVTLNDRAQRSETMAHCSGWLAEDELAAKTDANGNWEILNAPSLARNPKLQFQLLVDHPDFAGDRDWGDYQTKQGITSEQLRNGTATLVMDRGVSLRGTITDRNGAPVNQGLVIWVSNPYFATGVNEVPIQSDGTFQLPNLVFGKYPITVLAPGFAPEQREVDLGNGTSSCNFQLEPGHPIRIEIVDSAGKPIPKAYVSFRSEGWRGTSAIYNDKHPGVPESGIPRRADEQGVYVWDWAPPDAVEYTIQKAGYDLKAISLVARPEAHRVTLTAQMKISGTVVDARTGGPVSDFKVMPVKAFRSDSYSTNFQDNQGAAGKNGKFEIPIYISDVSTDRYRVRIEANGYRSALGRLSLAAGDAPLVEDFQLERVAPLTAQVFSPDGILANHFDVAIGSATTSPQFSLERPDASFGKAFKVNGRSTFEIAASFEPQRLRVFNDEGFAELLVQTMQQEIGEVRLQPYASVSGRLMQGKVPISNEGIYF